MKQNFFASKQRGAEKTPGFLVENHTSIAEECKHLNTVLRTPLDTNGLIIYHEFKIYCEDMLRLYDKTIRHDFKTPLRDNIAFAHASRTMLSFGRLIVIQILQLLEAAKYLGNTVHVNNMIELLMAPTQCFYVLSIVVPGLRLLTDLTNVIKYAYYPTETATETHELSVATRLASELYRARFSITNDILCVMFNTLTSFPEQFNISPPLATTLLFINLIIDICFLLYAHHVAHESFMKKKVQYDDEIISAYPGIMPNISQQQLFELELNYCRIRHNLNLSLLAGGVLLSGFILLFTAPLPVLAPVGSLLCLLGMSLYLTAETYAHYEQQDFILKHNKTSPQATAADILASEKATQQTWDDFLCSLITNTFFPAILMSTLVVSSPAALLLLIAFITFKLQSPEPEPLLMLIH